MRIDVKSALRTEHLVARQAVGHEFLGRRHALRYEMVERRVGRAGRDRDRAHRPAAARAGAIVGSIGLPWKVLDPPGATQAAGPA